MGFVPAEYDAVTNVADYAKPPLKEALVDVATTLAPLDDTRPVGGLLARHVGPRFSLDQVAGVDDFIEDERVQRYVRAFPLPGLVGVELEADSDGEVAHALIRELRVRIPEVAWGDVQTDLRGQLRKYGLLHVSLAAPSDETTGQPMAIEACGFVIAAGDQMPRDGSWDWFDYRRGLGSDYFGVPVPAPLLVRLGSVVYANVLYSGIGMPFYS